MLLCQFVPTSPSPAVSTVCSLCLHVYSCPANRFISTIFLDSIYMCSVQLLSRVDSLRPHGLQHARALCPSPTPGVHSKSLSQWGHPTILSCVISFSSCLQSFPAPGSLQMSQFFTSGGQSIEVSASASDLPMDTQNWSPLGWTGWISLHSKGLSRVFSNTNILKHQFFGAQLSW